MQSLERRFLPREFRRIEPSFAHGPSRPEQVSHGPAPAATVAKGESVVPGIVGLSFLALLAYGFVHRDDNWVTPEHGTGYWFGIAGSVAMLALLTYPLRKRFKSWRGLGRLPQWLSFHMLLGLAGPTLILFHANFKLGATNSNVALISMLTVMLSGVVGRYIYGKTHHRYSGEVRTLKEMRQSAVEAKGHVHKDLLADPRAQALLARLEQRVMNPDHGLLVSGFIYFDVSTSLRDTRRKLCRLAFERVDERPLMQGVERRFLKERKKTIHQYVTAYLVAVRNVAQFRFHERLFALWHVLHVPLLFLLVSAAVVHIVAVHLY